MLDARHALRVLFGQVEELFLDHAGDTVPRSIERGDWRMPPALVIDTRETGVDHVRRTPAVGDDRDAAQRIIHFFLLLIVSRAV